MSEPTDQAAVEHFLSSLPSSLAELAPKFTSWPHLIHSSSRQLKALGLTVKQRKVLLHHTELYKARQRRREMLQLLAQPATAQQAAVEVQQALYDIAYSHVYARQWKRAEESEAQHWWRQATEMNRMRKSFIRNQWNGVQVQTNPESIKPLRNPELMKAKLQEEIDNLKEMQQDGTASLSDRIDLLEHEQLMDELERPDLQDDVDLTLEEMAEDDQLREEIKVSISKARQEQLLETEADREAREAADRAEAVEEQDRVKAMKLGLRLRDDEQDDEEDEVDEEAEFNAMSQEEQDAVNQHMEDGMSEEEKEDARLELAVDRSIYSKEVRHAVQTELELTLLDLDNYEESFLDVAEAEAEAEEEEEVDAYGANPYDIDGSEGDEDSWSADDSGVTAPDVADAEYTDTSTDEVGATESEQSEQFEQSERSEQSGQSEQSEQSEFEQPTVSRRMQTRRQEKAALSKLFSYNGRKAEQ